MAIQEVETRERTANPYGPKGASYFPENHIDNVVFADKLNELGATTSSGNLITPEQIFKATGVNIRHFVHSLDKIPSVADSNRIREQVIVGMAEKAARRALLVKGWGHVNALISSTSVPYEQKSPSKALKAKLGLGSWVQKIDGDVIAECVSFIFALKYIKGSEGNYRDRRILYTATEYICPYGKPTDLDRTLFCDGAAALAFVPGVDLEILSAKTQVFDEYSGFIKGPIQRELCDQEALLDFVGIDPSDDPDGYETMDGPAVAQWILNEKTLPPIIETVQHEIGGQTPKIIIPHQANGKITRLLRPFVLRKVGLEEVFLYDNIVNTGNCASVTIPNAFGEILNFGWEENGERKWLEKGDIVLFVGFGAGMSAGVAAVRILR